jgi:hypothetical protein
MIGGNISVASTCRLGGLTNQSTFMNEAILYKTRE